MDETVSGKRVLLRVDFNVPMNSNGEIEDDTRIRACLPTITYLVHQQARVILCSHLGRPRGMVDEHLRLGPVARRLSEIIQRPVKPLPEAIGPGAVLAVSAMQDGELVFLENLRFYPGEEANDPGFARELSLLADLFVNDAFGVSHRAHASISGIAEYLPCVAGLLMEKEIEQLSSLFEEPAHPFAAIMGGAKVEEKIEVLEHILPRVDLVIIGGGMAAAFLKDQGYDVGISAGGPDIAGLIGTIMQKSEAFGVRILLPEDLIISEDLEFGATVRVEKAGQIPAGCRIVDIGPQTIMEFIKEIGECQTVVWNGPMGIFEIPQFSGGTTAVATVLATMNAKTIIGGGSTVEAVTQLGLVGRMTHVSTGGGATLRFLSGKTLPGIEVLADKE